MIKRKSRKRTSLNKITLKIFKTLIVLYILICIALFFFQEKLIFFPDKLEKNFQFSFENKFEELNVKTKDG
ncbi:MAG TPA: hypothetical protein VKI61_05455, partial [Chitinophagaceae bacterium]|nr:hypothetical protein [Chitinophagaceae bacterium]